MLEMVIAMFVLLTVSTFVLTLYGQSFQYLKNADRQFQGTLFAENTLAQVRAWAKEPTNYERATWAPFSNVTDPAFNDFKGVLTVAPAELSADCSALETGLAPATPVEMNSSSRRVTLDVSWRNEPFLSITTLVTEPERALETTDPVVVTSIAPLPPVVGVDQEVEFEAKLMDSAGQEIPDVEFAWSVLPGSETPGIKPGNASLVSLSRDGRKAVLKNRYIRYNGTFTHTGGTCRVVASARYWGAFYRGTSQDITLDQ